MDFSKLNQNEKLAVYGSIAAIVGPILSSAGFGFGAGGLTLLLAIAMLVIVFLPQFSPQTQLPGSKGSLMVIVGGIAAASAALALLSSLGWLGFFGSNIIFVLGWLVGIAGGLLMGWAGWQEFQAEGGKLQVGTTGSAATPGTTSAPAEQPASTTPPAPSAGESTVHSATATGSAAAADATVERHESPQPAADAPRSDEERPA